MKKLANGVYYFYFILLTGAIFAACSDDKSNYNPADAGSALLDSTTAPYLDNSAANPAENNKGDEIEKPKGADATVAGSDGSKPVGEKPDGSLKSDAKTPVKPPVPSKPDSGPVAADAAPAPQKDAQAGPPPSPPPPAPQKVKTCKQMKDCASGEVCLKLASDMNRGTQPKVGLCQKRCTNTDAPCSPPTSTEYHPCTSHYTSESGRTKACTIACETRFPWDGGKVKTYPCPQGTSCNRTQIIMKVCTPDN
jgi:hypothetical protein